MRVLVISLSCLLLAPSLMPAAAESAEWEEDSWLVNIIGPERLEMGDEIGCHGMPGLDAVDSHTVFDSCKNYLTERIEASSWGKNPLSFGSQGKEWSNFSIQAGTESGFRVFGGSGSHEGVLNIDSEGRTLEKGFYSAEEFEELLLSEPGHIDFQWRARDHDVIVRPESDLVNAIESTTAWFTTWGEMYSYSQSSTLFSVSNEGDSWLVENIPSNSHEHWSVPTTVTFSEIGANIVSVEVEGVILEEISEATRHLQTGWRQNGDDLLLTLEEGQQAEISFDRPAYHSLQVAEPRFNGLPLAITISGVHTTDLFDWSKRWDDTPMRFTWLIQPREVGQHSILLPALVVLVAISTPVAIFVLVRKDRELQSALTKGFDAFEIKREEE